MLGQVYEYFLGMFASAEGKRGGQFYTPASIVKTLVAVLAPHHGQVYDPCCGSGGMFVQSEKFIEAHGGKLGDVSIYGQEANPTTWRLAAMNLAIRGIDFNLGREPGDTFTRNQHPDLRADFILANPPFNISDWWHGSLKGDPRWVYGDPPQGNANYAWLQHMLHHLKPTGRAGIVLANGSMSSSQNNEGDIRAAMVDADVVEVMIALPGQLFFNTQIPACLWFLTKEKKRKGEVLFIDARKLGKMISARAGRTGRRRHRPHCRDGSRVAGRGRRWRLRHRIPGCTGLLPQRSAGRDCPARPCADAGPLCGRRRGGRRRRGLCRQDAKAD